MFFVCNADTCLFHLYLCSRRLNGGYIMNISVDKLMDALPIMGKGMLGIFVVTCVIIAMVLVLNVVTTKKQNKQ